jgi:rhamnogalacturonyl hydrolase YesR
MKGTTLLNIMQQLEAWLERQGFQGWDPHDALNSPFLKRLAFNRLAGVCLVQALKRSPVNFRPLLGVQKGVNPKGMGLFLSAYARRFQKTGDWRDSERIHFFADWLMKHASAGYSGLAWGYNFDWPNRSFYAPKGTPTIVNAAFIGFAFLDAYRATEEPRFLSCAESACAFILQDLRIAQRPTGKSSSYTPLDNACIYNANMLAAAFLAEVGAFTRRRELITEARDRMDFAVSRQHEDGSWFYGEERNQRWIDSFHTGYNLLALQKMLAVIPAPKYESALRKGYAFYLNHFFLDDGRVRYEANKIYPLDAHAFACAIICLRQLGALDESSETTLNRVIQSTLNLFWSGKGYFYARRGRFLTDRTPYMRWVQAWVFLALVELSY